MDKKIKKLIEVLKFKPQDGKDNIYVKYYGDYKISINYDEKSADKSSIDYGAKIIINRGTTTNFSQEENLVVLECVDRLLTKGYKPEKIELEKSWNLGRNEKGYLDILVKDKSDKSFLMIECKTWGKEYEKVVRETITNKKKAGGQVFSYLHQEPKTTKAVCYYASTIKGNSIEYDNSIIYNKPEWAELNQDERYSRWSETFENTGIFEDWVQLYNLESKAILRRDLKELKKEDSDGIYNKFAEILRHNVISDKPNAFNKIINLFLCKIYDENKAPEEEVKFQTRTGSKEKTDEELLEDLNDLYKSGMKEYLEKNISDCTKADFDHILKFIEQENKKEELEELYKTLRLYKNNEFAFKEVYDKKSFEENASVVREVVELLQHKQLRYSHKQQFLGDFFEKLLNDSIKQEAGQFFTPVPLAQFIVKSLPIKDFIKNNLKNNRNDVLPYIIDYACGAGHFLTEAMDEVDNIIKNEISLEDISTPTVKKDFAIWQASEYMWASKYIYGLDLDYRLIKTSKISCFLNGDGLANLLHANGLAPFSSEDYMGILQNKETKQDNPQFDILIANPPYSVKTFKTTVKDGEKSFELFKNLTENSSEIECLFVERAKQLLKEDGLAGIVLPVSLLTNDKIYIKTREILLKYFDIKGILALQDNAFMATGTKTIILFMKRRNNTDWELINQHVKNFFKNYQDVTVYGIEKAFSKFVTNAYEDLTFEDYISILKDNPTDAARKNEFFTDTESLSTDALRQLEADKMLYFFLSYNSKIVLANSGEKATEKEFLGYEFSNRRGYEGISIHKDECDNILTGLFSDVEPLSSEKLNYYMYNNFIGTNLDFDIQKIQQDEVHPLKNHVDYCSLSELIDFSTAKFDKIISINAKKKLKIESKYELVKISAIKNEIINGATPFTKEKAYWNAKEICWATIDDFKDIYIQDTIQKISKKGLEKVRLVPINSVLLSCTATLGKVAINKIPITTNQQINSIVCNDRIIPEYLAYFLNSISHGLQYLTDNVGVKHLNQTVLGNIKLPLPPLEIQQKIVDEIMDLELLFKQNSAKIEAIQKDFEKLITISAKELRLGSLQILLKRGKSPKYSHISDIQIIKSGQVRGLREFDFKKKFYASPAMGVDERLLQKGDLLINSTGVGTAGRVNIFDLEEQCFVDSHIAILRLNQTLALPLYVLYQLYANIGFKNMEKMATGQSGQIELSPDTIASIRIPVPSIEEQKIIVSKILPLEQEIAKLKQELENVPTLKQDILDKYLK